MENRKIAVSTSQSLKDLLDTGRTAIEERFRSSGDGIRASIEQTALMDRVLSLAFEECAGEAGQEIAVLALGGYGRGEQFPHSDVDVMILSGTGQQQIPAGVTARAFLHVLWDVGLNVGHSVRTIAEALAQHGAAIAAWIANIILDMVLVFVPVLGWFLMFILHLGIIISILALAIIGIINAANGVCKPLPVIGNRFTLIK